MIEKLNKQKCDPLRILSLNLEKMLANTYLYADIRKTVMFLISLGIWFSAEWSMDFVCSTRSSHFCLLLTKREMRGGARGREKVRDGVRAAELLFRKYTTRFIVHNKCPT